MADLGNVILVVWTLAGPPLEVDRYESEGDCRDSMSATGGQYEPKHRLMWKCIPAGQYFSRARRHDNLRAVLDERCNRGEADFCPGGKFNTLTRP